MRRATRKLGFAFHALVIDFGNRDLGLLGVARICVSFASWSFAIALGVYGFEAHGAVGVGIVALVRFLPGAIVSPFAGLLVDRYPRIVVLLVSSVTTTAVLAGATLAASLDAPSAVVFIFPALFAITSCAYAPAESALMPGLARSPQELSAGNVTHSAMENSGFLLAAIVTGLLLGATSPAYVFGVAAGAWALATLTIAAVKRDSRPTYGHDEQLSGIVAELGLGLRALVEHPALRLSSATLITLLLFEGFADVIGIVMVLELLHLEEGSVGFLSASWGLGALLGGAGLALLFDRGKLVIAIAIGSVILGLATMLPGIWPREPVAYLGWLAVGAGFTLVDVAAKTLMQRLGSDETMGRVIGSLESARLAAMAIGSIGAIVLLELVEPRGALLILGALMPIFVILCWSRLRGFEVGAPVAEEQYLLLRENSIFAPLPIAVLERLSHDLVTIDVEPGEDVIVQGEIGDRFFLIESGEVEVIENGDFRRTEGPGESFGEIALLYDVPRTATVRAKVATRLLALERDQFLTAVTGHRRSQQVARDVVDDRWADKEAVAATTK